MGVHPIGNRSISLPDSSSRSDQTVAEVQHTLNAINRTNELPENGIFDRNTENAIRRFQSSSGIEQTGTINPQTIDALNRREASMRPETAENQAPPPLSEADRNRRIQELRIQEPVVRGGLEEQSRGGEVYGTAAEALRDPNPHSVRVRGHDFQIYGATDSEAAVIRNSLERLPSSHLDRVPPNMVVADTLTNRRTSGGAQFPHDADHPRVEISRRSLHPSAQRVESGHEGAINSALLHEIGHCVGSGMYGNRSEAYRSAPYDALQDLPADVPSSSRAPESRGRIERYAQAYMMYFGGSDRRRPQGLTPEQREAMRAHFENAEIPDDR